MRKSPKKANYMKFMEYICRVTRIIYYRCATDTTRAEPSSRPPEILTQKVATRRRTM